MNIILTSRWEFFTNTEMSKFLIKRCKINVTAFAEKGVPHLLWNCNLLLISFEGQPNFSICYESSNEDLFLPGSLLGLLNSPCRSLLFHNTMFVHKSNLPFTKEIGLKSISLFLYHHFLKFYLCSNEIWILMLDQTIIYTTSKSYHSTLTNCIISTSYRQLWQICVLNLLYLQWRLGLNMIINNCMPIDNKIPP